MKPTLLYTNNMPAAKAEIEHVNGKISQQFTEHLFTAELPEAVAATGLKYASSEIPEQLNETSRLAYDAWMQYQGKGSLKELAPDFREGLPWDTEGFQSPRDMNELNVSGEATDKGIALSTGTPTSLYMIGSIAAGIVIVSGPNELQFTEAETREVISEVQEGLDFLAGAEPRAKVSFVYDIHNIQVTATPGSVGDFESAESPWRNEALGKMGFTPSRQGSVEYVNDLKQGKQTDWAYVAYFTKYPLRHFAYAIDEKLVMSFFNDGWGPQNINCVFAHETCHIFGAADEYGTCSCTTVHGFLSVPNGNCRACAPASVDCLMDRNMLTLCDFTRQQIGWSTQLFPKP